MLLPRSKPIGGSKSRIHVSILLHMKGRLVGIRSPVAGLYIRLVYLRLD
jgi:hypothetical protein